MADLVRKSAVKEVLKKVGGDDLRVSQEAVEKVVEMLNELFEEKAKKMVELVRFAKRKTVLPDDVKLAFNQ